MNRINTLFRLVLHPKQLLYRLVNKYPWIIKDDKKYIQFLWKFRMNYPLNLDNPKTYNEKLQWLKLYYKDSSFTTMVDKYLVKEYVANIIGKEYIIPTLNLWNDVDSIWNYYFYIFFPCIPI